MNFAAPRRTSVPEQIQLPKEEVNGGNSMKVKKEEEVGETMIEEEKVQIASDIAPPPPAFDNHSPIKEEVQKEEVTVEKNEEEGVHHATVANVTGDGESASLESYGTCAVALYDYQVK